MVNYEDLKVGYKFCYGTSIVPEFTIQEIRQGYVVTLLNHHGSCKCTTSYDKDQWQLKMKKRYRLYIQDIVDEVSQDIKETFNGKA